MCRHPYRCLNRGLRMPCQGVGNDDGVADGERATGLGNHNPIPPEHFAISHLDQVAEAAEGRGKG